MNDISNNLPDIDLAAPLPENVGLPDILNGEADTVVVQTMWGLDPGAMNEVMNIGRVYNSKHGMFASVPIICRGSSCAYKDTCMVKTSERKVGQRCPMEIAAIMNRFSQYCQHFEIDMSIGVVEPEDLVDVTLIKDLVTLEVTMMRAENKIALNGDFMATTLLDIDKKCNPYFGKIVSPEEEHLLSLQEKKQKILNQLNATRKDKSKEKQSIETSNAALKIYKEVQGVINQKQAGMSISDMTFDDEVIIDEEENVNEDRNNGESDT